MLKRLELVGFKSFADKTLFDFGTGITAIVGPNGSGKSNVVDAVRWIMGEQGAKSLRGGEMADVIFNGSTSRKSLGLAEVTMTFDNSKRQLSIDQEEVAISRRVYRSGEGEYLINHQLCRLKDIKDLFLGSGAGNQAYCIIEQGRVDGLLQASNKERRNIFEEAAGISRFKLRKIETMRKLERVDQNLQQLRIVLDELEKQLRSVKLQASKAQRYQEYSERLQQLRIAIGLEEYHHLTGQLHSVQEVLDALRADLSQHSSETRESEAEVRRLDEALAQLDASIHDHEAKQSQAKQQIAAAEATLARERNASAELETDLARNRVTLTELNARMTTLVDANDAATKECGAIEARRQAQRTEVETLNESLQSTIVRLKMLQMQIHDDAGEHQEQMRRQSRLQNDLTSRQALLAAQRRERDKLQHKGEQAAEHLANIDVELQSLCASEETLQGRLAAANQGLAERIQQRDRFRQLSEAATALIGDMKAQRSGLASRIEVLDGLERTHDGIGAGAREVLALLEKAEPGPWRSVMGIVADFLTVPREHAHLIDLALADTAEHFLVRDPAMLGEALAQRTVPFSSRVSFVPIGHRSSANGHATADTYLVDGRQAGEQARKPEGGTWAVDLVTCDHPELRQLSAQLLGNTLIVADLPTAHRMAADNPGLRFLTRKGELLEGDGTLTVGEYHAGAGILSRKSELRELRQQAEALDQRIHATESDLAGLRNQSTAMESQVADFQEQIKVLTEQAADLRSRIGQHREKRSGLHEEMELSRKEASGLDQEIASLEESSRTIQAQVEAVEKQLQEVHARKEQAEREIRDKEQLRLQQEQGRSDARAGLAAIEERLTAVRAKQKQIEGDLAQRRQERLQGEQLLAQARGRREESQRTMLQAQSELAQWYLEKEAAQRRVSELTDNRDSQRQKRKVLTERLQAAQTVWKDRQQNAHERELEANNLHNRIGSLAGRLREDYQIELEKLYEERVGSGRLSVVSEEKVEPVVEAAEGQPAAEEPLDAAKVNEEIEELRRKLSRLGNVNLEALQELVDLEKRHGELQTQVDDLTTSQKSLQEIIAQINQDSRKLFSEAFTTIRGHFQELFRKLFGGGMADIVLEDENDILECGIEIIARPPGKELRSISLMSGGEKTMTAVALLLAIFRSRPSPFCLLDEVDAALDEANIGRFTAVLREFLDLSQFILITHSKKTMATADTLYGITMQESGISKQVSVKFEDWPDENRGKNGEAKAIGNGTQVEFGGR